MDTDTQEKPHEDGRGRGEDGRPQGQAQRPRKKHSLLTPLHISPQNCEKINVLFKPHSPPHLEQANTVWETQKGNVRVCF